LFSSKRGVIIPGGKREEVEDGRKGSKGHSLGPRGGRRSFTSGKRREAFNAALRRRNEDS